jgi:uncharacterized protein
MTRVMKCPICRKEIAWQGNPYRPFCSARCRITDLGAWAAEAYRIPDEKTETESQDEQPMDDQTVQQSRSSEPRKV